MKLYLVRHGNSAPFGSDDERTLSEAGRDEVQRLAQFIETMKLHVSHIFHSKKLRAIETATILSAAVKSMTPMQLRVELDPVADVNTIMHEVEAIDEDVLLVGHMPFMGRLLSQLVVGNENRDIVNFETATMVCLEQVERHHWVICWVLNPSLFISS